MSFYCKGSLGCNEVHILGAYTFKRFLVYELIFNNNILYFSGLMNPTGIP